MTTDTDSFYRAARELQERVADLNADNALTASARITAVEHEAKLLNLPAKPYVADDYGNVTFELYPD